MRVWEASGADPRCTLSCTKVTVALSYAAFRTPCFTNRWRLPSRSTLYFIPLATRTNGASAFPENCAVEPQLAERPRATRGCKAGAYESTQVRGRKGVLWPVDVRTSRE